MQKSISSFSIKGNIARVISTVGSGIIIGAFIGVLLGTFITGSISASNIVVWAILGGIFTFIGGLLRDFQKIKEALTEKMKGLNEEERISLLGRALEKELIPIQVWAIKELGKIRNEKAIYELKKALNHNSRYIQKKATESLKKLAAL